MLKARSPKSNNNMHPELTAAIDALGLGKEVPTLRHNADLTDARVKDSREFLRKGLPPTNVPLDVVALGSMGRQESSTESDFDWLVLAHGLPADVNQSRALIDLVNGLQVALEMQKPGPTGVFGRVISSPDLTEFIGLEEDTNRSLTHRILILGESVSLYQPDLHNELVRRIFERYFVDYKKPKEGVPRFLLNDALRYWRTLAVDYQAKRWQGRSDWGLRYLKLLISRKLSFAGFVIPLLICERTDVEYFVQQFKMPPLARIAQLHKFGSEFNDPLRVIVRVAEAFSSSLSDPVFRGEAEKAIAPGDKEHWPQSFIYVKKDADKLQEALEEMFFESDLLRSKAKKYLSF